MKKRWSSLLLILVFLAGLSLLLYPTISEQWNRYHQSHAITEYANLVSALDDKENEALFTQAEAYNREIAVGMIEELSEERKQRYESLLDPGADGIMAYVEIPSIQCTLPIYHGTDEAELAVAVGHLE